MTKKQNDAAIAGEAPPMTPDADGWWWVWMDEQWCAATLKFEPESVIEDPTIRLTFLRATGEMRGYTIRATDVAEQVWGGQIAVPAHQFSLAEWTEYVACRKAWLSKREATAELEAWKNLQEAATRWMRASLAQPKSLRREREGE